MRPTSSSSSRAPSAVSDRTIRQLLQIDEAIERQRQQQAGIAPALVTLAPKTLDLNSRAPRPKRARPVKAPKTPQAPQVLAGPIRSERDIARDVFINAQGQPVPPQSIHHFMDWEYIETGDLDKIATDCVSIRFQQTLIEWLINGDKCIDMAHGGNDRAGANPVKLLFRPLIMCGPTNLPDLRWLPKNPATKRFCNPELAQAPRWHTVLHEVLIMLMNVWGNKNYSFAQHVQIVLDMDAWYYDPTHRFEGHTLAMIIAGRCQQNHVHSMLELLPEALCHDPTLRTSSGATVAMLAARSQSLVTLPARWRHDPLLVDKYGFTALMTFANHTKNTRYEFKYYFIEPAEENDGQAIHHWKHPLSKTATTGTSIASILKKFDKQINAPWCSAVRELAAPKIGDDELSSLSE